MTLIVILPVKWQSEYVIETEQWTCLWPAVPLGLMSWTVNRSSAIGCRWTTNTAPSVWIFSCMKVPLASTTLDFCSTVDTITPSCRHYMIWALWLWYHWYVIFYLVQTSIADWQREASRPSLTHSVTDLLTRTETDRLTVFRR